MEPNTVPKNERHETMPIIIVIILVLLGGVFYGIDLYKKAKAPAQQEAIPADGPVEAAG